MDKQAIINQREYDGPMRISSLLRTAAMLWITAGITAALFAQNVTSANPADNECQNATTTSEMRACENARNSVAQRELGVAYDRLLQHLDADQKQKLQVAQRAWIRFRDANAAFQASLAQGGTLAPLMKIGALTEMTRARTSELKKATLP